MKMVQRILSYVLTACMLLSLLAGLSVTAFAEEDTVTLSFSGATSEALTEPISGLPGSTVTLPTSEAPWDGYDFIGWTLTDTPLAQTDAEPVYYPEGGSFTLPEENTTLYALYSYVDHRGTPSIDRYEKITSMEELKDGSYLIGVEHEGKLRVFDGSSASPTANGNYQDLELNSSDYIACSAASDACAVSIYQLENSDAYGIQMENGTGKYIGSIGKTGLISKEKEPYPLTVEFDENGILIYVVAKDKAGTNYYLSYYQTSIWQRIGFYNNIQSTFVDLYRRIDGIDGTLYYTGTAANCAHDGARDVIDPTCTNDGYTLCLDCGYKYTADGQEATGHDYVVSEVVDPTEYLEGYTLYVCSNCGDSYKDNIVEPLGEDYKIKYVVLGETWRTDTVNSYEGTDLPEPDVLPDGYEFAGWSNLENSKEVDNAFFYTDKDFENAETGENDHKFHPANDITLYAVYKRGEYEAGSGDFVKITEMPADGLYGQFLVVYEAGNIAFNSAFATTATNLAKPGNYLSVEIVNHTIAATTDLNAAAVLIGEVDTKGTYYMQINSGLKIGSTGSSAANGINGDKNKTYENNIFVNSNGTVVIANIEGDNTYNFSYNDSSVDRFAFCKPTTKTVHEVCLYQKQEGTTTYFYTTAPATAGCEHEEYSETETAPTCTEAGYTTYTCTNCGYKWTEAGVAALGHTYDNGVATAPTPTAVGYTTYSCTVCGDSYQDNFVGFNFEITYNVLGTDRAPVVVNNKDGADFPTDVPDVKGYKFFGWAEEEIPEEIIDASVLTGYFIPTEDATYYAVYTRKEANEGDGNYYKVTSLPLVDNGNYLIVNEANGLAFKAYEESEDEDNPYVLGDKGNYFPVEISDNMIEESEAADFASITINPIDGTAYYSLAVSETGEYIGNTGAGTGWNSKANNGKNAPYETSITIDASGYAIMNNVGGSNTYQILFNHATNSNKVAFYASTNKTCDPVSLYLKDGSGFTTYYTTRPTIDCAHENTTEVEAVEPTCTENGCTAGVFCNDCQTWVSGHETIEKIAHSYIEDERAEATCGQDGFIAWVCKYCDASYEEILPATGEHTYNANGVCTVCADKLINIESAALRMDEDIDVIYTAKVPESATAAMTFTVNGNSVEVADDGSHTFAFTGVNPQCIGDSIAAVLTVKLGENTYTDTKAEYSVREYCISQLSKTEDAKLRTLLSDVLAYGAAAQTYMNYNTGALVNAGDDIADLTCSEYSDLSGLAASFEGTASDDIYWTGAYLTLTNSAAMTFCFNASSVDGLTVNITINGRTESFTDFNKIGEGKYTVTFTGIKASEFGDAVSASFYRNGAQVGNTVSYSVNTYICAKQNDSNTALASLVKALYNYGAAALAYAEE